MKLLVASIAAMAVSASSAESISLWPTQTKVESDSRRELLAERMTNQRLSSVSTAHFFSTENDIYRGLAAGLDIDFGIPSRAGDMIKEHCTLLSGNPVVPAALQEKYADDIKLFHCVTSKGGELEIIFDTSRVDGLSATFFSNDRRVFYVDSAQADTSNYVIYDAEIGAREGIPPLFDSDTQFENFELLAEFEAQFEGEERRLSVTRELASDFPAFKFKLAPLASKEYSFFHGNTISSVLKEIIVCFSRVNGVYVHELGVYLELIEDADLGICLQGSTNPTCINLDNDSSVINTALSTLNALGVPASSYDVGHVLTTGSGGLAALASVCSSTRKASGTTGLAEPYTDVYYIDYVAHEIGHQMNGGHVFMDCSGPRDGNLMKSSAAEPGSGTSIMGYAGICGNNNVQSNSDPYFNNLNQQQMRDFVVDIGSTGNCGTMIDLEASLPTLSTASSCKVPLGNYFQLNGKTNSDASEMTYFSWDRVDTAIEDFDSPTLGAFRSWKPTVATSRFFPNLHALNFPQANSFKVEKLPTEARDMTFRFTERRLYKTTAVTEVFSETIMGDFVFKDVGVEFANVPALTLISPAAGAAFKDGEKITVQWSGLSGNDLIVEILIAVNTLEDIDNSLFDYETDNKELDWIKVGEAPMELGKADVVIPSGFGGKETNIMIRSTFGDDVENCFFFDLHTGVQVAESEPTDSGLVLALGSLMIIAGVLLAAFTAVRVARVTKKAPVNQATEKSANGVVVGSEAEVKETPKSSDRVVNPMFSAGDV